MIEFKIKMWNSTPKSVCGNLIDKYKNNKYDYYTVVIFDDFSGMYEYADKHFEEDTLLERDYSGICKYITKSYYEDKQCTKLVRMDKSCGYILLQKDCLGVGTVSHECTHAINYYFKYRIKNYKKVFEIKEYDELFAYMLGSLTNQIYNKLYKEKII